MLFRFEPVYLHSRIKHQLISKWKSQANISCSHEEFVEGRVLVLPPMPPTPLRVCICAQCLVHYHFKVDTNRFPAFHYFPSER